MLRKHEFYIYHEGPEVFARAGENERVLMQTCVEDPGPDPIEFPHKLRTAAQVAHDVVKTYVNPKGLRHDVDFTEPDEDGNEGFHHKDYQDAISTNCESAVRAAYEAAGVKLSEFNIYGKVEKLFGYKFGSPHVFVGRCVSAVATIERVKEIAAAGPAYREELVRAAYARKGVTL